MTVLNPYLDLTGPEVLLPILSMSVCIPRTN